jgi:hypothetical protein
VGFIARAACFAVMMRDVSPCRKIASALSDPPPRETMLAHQRVFSRHAVTTMSDAL